MKKSYSPQQAGKSTIGYVIVAAIAIAVGLVAQQVSQQAMPKLEKLILLPKPKTLGEVKFTTHEGRDFSEQNLKGKWTILFFAFTNCPDICPSTLHELKQVKRELVANKTWPAFQIAMVSVDPERDTVERMRQYVPFFDPEFIGLRSDDLAYTTEFTKNLGILFFKGETLPDGGYDVDHGASLILINPAGEYAGVISAPHKKEVLLADLQKLGRFALDTNSITPQAKHESHNKAHAVTIKGAIESPSKLVFENAWVRPTPPNAPAMAGYVKIINQGQQDVRIVDAQSPLFDMAMIHQTVITDGIAAMQHMDGLVIKAGASVELAPLGTHIMLMRPETPLPVGAQVPIRFTLDNGEIIDVSIEVRDNPAE